MDTPIFDSEKTRFELFQATARIEARKEIADELRKVPRPSKVIKDLIARFERG